MKKIKKNFIYNQDQKNNMITLITRESLFYDNLFHIIKKIKEHRKNDKSIL